MINILLHNFRKHSAFLLMSLGLGATLGACDAEEPCASQLTNRFLVGFYVPGEEEGEIESAPFFFDEVIATGAERPFFVWDGTITNGLSLSLDPNSDTTTFVFGYEGEHKDTLQLAYRRTSRMISTDCELAIKFSDIRMIKEPFTEDDEISVELLSTELTEANPGADLRIISRKECEPQAEEDREITIGFFTLQNGVKEPESISFQSISPQGSDEIYYLNSEPRSAFTVDLNPDANTITYVFQQTGLPNQTLRINYERRLPVEISSAFCFPDYTFAGITAETTFDSVSVINKSLPDDSESIDIEIYR